MDIPATIFIGAILVAVCTAACMAEYKKPEGGWQWKKKPLDID